MRKTWIGFCCGLLAVGCGNKTVASNACKVTSDCAAGSFCNSGVCGPQCTTTANCASGSVCTAAGTCIVSSSGTSSGGGGVATPTITSVVGTSTLPKGSDGRSYISAATGELRILGTNLSAVTAVDLLSPALVEIGSLPISSAEAGEIDVTIPGSVAQMIINANNASGASDLFALQVTAGASVVRDNVMILQGEPGVSGGALMTPLGLPAAPGSTTLTVTSSGTDLAMSVSGESDFAGAVKVTGATTLTGATSIAGAATITASAGTALAVTGATTVAGTSTFTATTGNALTVSGPANATALNVTGNAAIDKATFSGVATFNGGVGLTITTRQSSGTTSAYRDCNTNEVAIAGGCDSTAHIIKDLPLDSSGDGANDGVAITTAGGWKCTVDSATAVNVYVYCLQVK